jgi:hypothetical protein
LTNGYPNKNNNNNKNKNNKVKSKPLELRSRVKIIFSIKWGKFVHGEVREFFLQKLIFAVLCTVLGVFRPRHRIYEQLQTNKCIIYLKQPYSSTFI